MLGFLGLWQLTFMFLQVNYIKSCVYSTRLFVHFRHLRLFNINSHSLLDFRNNSVSQKETTNFAEQRNVPNISCSGWTLQGSKNAIQATPKRADICDVLVHKGPLKLATKGLSGTNVLRKMENQAISEVSHRNVATLVHKLS